MNQVNPFRIRSLLFIPAIKKDFVEKAISLEGLDKPDGLVFDLEDSVHSDFKDKARANLFSLQENDVLDKLKSKYVIAIRINELNSQWFNNDLKMINSLKPDFLMLSKIDTSKNINYIRRKSSVKQLIIAVETLEGLSNLSDITSEMNFYDLFCAGYEDPSADLLIERPDDLDSINPLTFFLMQCLIEARSKNLVIIDAPSRKYSDENSLKEFEKECAFNEKNGLNCKFAIHPNQVAIINKVFDKQETLNQAEKILGQFKNLDDGSFVIVNKNKEMMDTPSFKMYSKILDYWNK